MGADSAAEDGAVEVVPKLNEAREACAVDRLCWLDVEPAYDAVTGVSGANDMGVMVGIGP
jgi:hypothetical protein